jgi:hypothetical protein
MGVNKALSCIAGDKGAETCAARATDPAANADATSA